jgi:S-adenosylmethionine:diacylglycerol 3-amino-3-carboxypropyl transferase
MAAKEFQFLYFDESVFILDIPKNYSVKNIPEQKTYTDKNFTYTYTYQQSNNRIIYKQSSKVFNMLIEPEDFNQWNNQMDVLARIYKDNIILTEK